MNYTERIVTEGHLKGDVLCYWQMSGNIDSSSGVTSRYLPKGQNLLVLNYGNEIEYLDTQKVKFLNPQFFIVPAITTSRIINQKGHIDLFGISFIGDGLYKLIEQPISKIKSDFPDNLRLKFENLHKALNAMIFSEKIEFAEKFLTENLNQKLNSPPFQQAIKIINQSKGGATVSDIADKVHVSERQLQRLFKTRIGISPKAYCKIIRVNNYLDFILNKESSIDWMELVVEYNYHDQPHFINEVKAITKLSPKKLQHFRDTLYHRYTRN